MTLTVSFPVAFALLCACAAAAVLHDHVAQIISMPKPAFRHLTTGIATENEPFDRLSSRVIVLSNAALFRRDGESAVDLVVPTTDHQSSGDGNCAFTNYACITTEALEEVNIIRAQVSVAPFKIGTVSQLNNAVWYSKKLSKLGKLKHQNLQTTPLDCNTFFSGENIAQNWARAPVNVARKCVLQLKDSPPHYKNMISTYHKFFVMGVYVEPSGKTWCVQTFGIRTEFGTGKCMAVSGGSAPLPSRPTPTAAPKAPITTGANTASTGYKFKTLTFKAMMDDGTAVTPVLECATQCRYCFLVNGKKMCLSESYSISIDKQISS